MLPFLSRNDCITTLDDWTIYAQPQYTMDHGKSSATSFVAIWSLALKRVDATSVIWGRQWTSRC